MGNNGAFTSFERSVIGIYNVGRLDKEILTILGKSYKGQDIDEGGCMNLKAHDGKTVQQIIIETWGVEYPKLPENASYEERDEYNEQVWELFSDVTDNFW